MQLRIPQHLVEQDAANAHFSAAPQPVSIAHSAETLLCITRLQQHTQLQFPHNLAEQNAATAHSSAAATPRHFLEHSLGRLRIRRQLRNPLLFELQLLIRAFPRRLR
jgi:hypothetical protein